MKFFNIDQHISVIADVKHIFSRLGHTIDDWCLSGHAAVMGRRSDNDKVPMLADENWCAISNDNRWDEFYDHYKADLDKYDGFIVTYPPQFAYLYEKFNKPIILQVPIRFDYGFHQHPKRVSKFLEYLASPNIRVCANSRFDQHYLQCFKPDLSVKYIPSLCEYTGMKYYPDNGMTSANTVLYYATKPFAELPQNYQRREAALPGGYSWQQVAMFRAIVHFPYQVSTMSMFEQYTGCIPLFVPSIKFMLELYIEGRVLEHYSNFLLWNHEPGSLIPFHEEKDPNAYDDLKAVEHWLQYADYYQKDMMPDVTTFDSFDEMQRKITNADLVDISNTMARTNITRKQMAYSEWESVLGSI